MADLPIERFDHRVGLTSLQVHMSVIANDGRLWAATPAGLACYDGVRVRVYGRQHGLHSHGLRTLAIHPASGNLWIGTDSGIEVLDVKRSDPVSLWNKALGTVNCLALQWETAMVGSTQGLWQWDQNIGFDRVISPSESHDNIEKILAAADGSFWVIGSGAGLTRFSSGPKQGDIDTRYRVIGKARVISEGPDDTVWIGGSNGLCQLDSKGRLMRHQILGAPIDALYWDRDDIWVCFNQTLATISVIEFGDLPPKTHLKNVPIKHIMGDRFDNIWLSTSGQALLKISNLRNTIVDGFPMATGQILSIFSDANSQLIGGTSGLVLPSGKIILSDLEIWDVVRDGEGKIWSATDKGLFCTPNSHLSFSYRHEDCRVIQAPCRALIIFKGQLYTASIRGLARVGLEGVEEIFDPKGQSLGYVYSLHVGPNGNLWIASLGQGLFYFDGEKVRSYDVSGMAKNSNVYAITHDRAGRLYFAHDNRITRQDETAGFKTLLEGDGSVAAWSMGWLDGGNLVIGSASGLTIIDDESGRIKHRISGNFEDIPWEFTTSRSLKVLDDNALLCGLGTGLRTVRLHDLIPRNESPQARLANVSWQGVSTSINKNGQLTVPEGNWRVIFEISTEWFLDRCQMRYRLKGFDSAWSDFQALGSIQYTSLPKGRYELNTEIRSPLAGIGPQSKILEFEINS